MTLLHWLKCYWNKWSERKTREIGWYNPRTGTSTHSGIEHYQTRECKICNKMQERIIKNKDDY